MSKVYKATGKRKTSVAQVTMVFGKGKITVNGQDVNDFFPFKSNVMNLMQPLVATSTDEKFDIDVVVNGGGYSGQAGAVRHGITKALLEFDENNRLVLKKAGFITRDSRKKERKKPGLVGARKAPQFSKR